MKLFSTSNLLIPTTLKIMIIIVDPNGNVVAKAKSEEDELIVHSCDMDACNFGKSTIFDFARHRRIEHYKRIGTQTGVVRPNQ